MNKFLLALLFSLAAATAMAAQVVGEITFAIGQAHIETEQGRQRAQAGGPIHVGDTVQTGAGGHVHIRFVDNAYVSVRPNSRLLVVDYHYDPAQPKASRVKFLLEEGVARSITGRAGEAARERFRLNTPIAAIGVRGTDFIVHARPEEVRVTVARGAVVLAPFGEGCAAEGYGPCDTPLARELSAAQGQAMLLLKGRQGTPELLFNGHGLPTPDQLVPPAPQEPKAVPGGIEPAADGRRAPEGVGEALATGLVPEAVPTPKPASLVWGRWADPAAPGDLSVSYAEAANGREITVGNGRYGLFRDKGQPFALPGSGQAEFRLQQAQVHLAGASGFTPGRVEDGRLSIDFDAARFQTGLGLRHEALTAGARLQASGKINPEGIFVADPASSNGRVAGALSRDGQEAGYFFEVPTPAGTLTGTTLWAR